ncbi:uncharacterized protein LOC132754050, partial [Ruditapes philippinarum]|uniref:uncharacterized protein LOC132754050 n=1 Tax=Ruditapes philippinarum TaxID=129788 RepID=UPI00295AE632
MKLKMRPDEHKKKKNTQYKKKHGISEKENKIKEDPRNKTNVQDQKAKLTNVNGAESKEFQQSDKTKDKVKLEETEEVSKHYGKRKLESNWSRYEDDSDSEVEDDLPLQRGEDFNKLLAQAGGSASQFRLKDEEEWNVEGSDTSPALALDLDSLSQSLDCIPLHERLGIKENVFTEEQIIEMKGYSADVEQKYRTTFPIASNKNKSKNSGQESAGIVTNNNDS